jgi:aquaporin Z
VDRKTAGPLFAELVGTFTFFLIGLTAILSAKAFGAATGTQPGTDLVVIAFGFGLGLFVAIQAFGAISGGHFNPAVTLAAVLDRRMDWLTGVGYVVAQLVGGIAAAALLMAVRSQADVAGTETLPGSGFTDIQAALFEGIFTAFFVAVILTSTKKAPSQAAYAIPLALLVIHFALVPFTGSSVNPARSIASAVVGGNLDSLWVYIVGPLVGAAIGWAVYRFAHGDSSATA